MKKIGIILGLTSFIAASEMPLMNNIIVLSNNPIRLKIYLIKEAAHYHPQIRPEFNWDLDRNISVKDILALVEKAGYRGTMGAEVMERSTNKYKIKALKPECHEQTLADFKIQKSGCAEAVFFYKADQQFSK